MRNRETKLERRHRLLNQLSERGFTFDEAQTLRRIEMTLHRWSEHEWNGNIQREGENSDGKPRWFSAYALERETNPKGYLIADRETGALKRLAKLMEGHPEFVAYHQGDPRGCALYIVRTSDLKDGNIESLYTRGLAVCD
jgi:hypothetical protein